MDIHHDPPAPPIAPPQAPAPPSAPAPPAPVGDSSRILALDVARGIALFGIFAVNIDSFGQPIGDFLNPIIDAKAPVLDQAAALFRQVFCEGRFFPLFSLLFGIGLVLQRGRITATGRDFWPLYSRRLILLAAIGLTHALFLWYGDILFVYACCGFILMALAWASRRVLLLIAALLLAGVTLLTGTLGILMAVLPEDAFRPPSSTPSAIVSPESPGGPSSEAPAEPAPIEASAPTEAPAPTEATPPVEAAAAPESPADLPAVSPAPDTASPPQTPVRRLIRGFMTGEAHSPDSAVWKEAELEAFGKGPFWQAFGVRAISWVSMIIFSLFGYGWDVLAMFFLGAALVKYDFFSRDNIRWPRRFFYAAALVGLPLSILLATAQWFIPHKAAIALRTLFIFPLGAIMALGYLSAVVLLVHAGIARRAAGLLANAGRMALTVYLGETVVATFIMYWWGLGYFGQTSASERFGIVVVVYLGLLLFANVWLCFFRFGPMEWLWRSLTYLKPQPLLRRPRPSTPPA